MAYSNTLDLGVRISEHFEELGIPMTKSSLGGNEAVVQGGWVRQSFYLQFRKKIIKKASSEQGTVDLHQDSKCKGC